MVLLQRVPILPVRGARAQSRPSGIAPDRRHARVPHPLLPGRPAGAPGMRAGVPRMAPM